MAKSIDTILRNLTEAGPAEWNAFLGGAGGDPARVSVIDSNISTSLFEVDGVLYIADPIPWIHHIEMQASRDSSLGERLHVYSALLRYRHRVPVRTTVVLLRIAERLRREVTFRAGARRVGRHGDLDGAALRGR